LYTFTSILHHFRDKVRYWLKIMIFSGPLAFDAPVRWSTLEYCHPFWYGKTTMVLLPYMRICSAVSTAYWQVTDIQTDILPRHNPRYVYTSCGNECIVQCAQL